MRKSVTKIVKAVLGFALAIGVGVGAAVSSPKANPVVAASETVEFTPANTTSWNSTQGAQSQTIGGIIFESDSGANNTQLRLYSGGTHTFTSTVGNITSILFTCTANGTANYGPGKLSGDGYTASSGKTGEWTGDAVSVTVTGGQARCTSIVVTYTPSAGNKTTTATTVTAAGSKTTLDLGLSTLDTVQLSASVTYNNGANSVQNPEIAWTGNKDEVATINSTGLVTPVGKGEVRFTATYAGDSTYTASLGHIDITVVNTSEVIFKFADIASNESWENSKAYSPVVVDNVTITAAGGGNNSKYYTSDSTWRMYNGGSLTITPPAGKSISSVVSNPSHTFVLANDHSYATAAFNATVQFKSITVTLGAPKVLDTISASLTDTSKTWRVNDVVSKTDLTIVTHYTDGSDGDPITDGTGVTVTNGTLTIAGNNTVNVSYGGKSTTVTVNALTSTIVDWTITGSIEDTVKSTAYNLDGLTLHAWYDVGKTDEASSSVADLYELVANPTTAGATPDPDNEIEVKVYLKSDTGHTNCLKTFSNVAAPIINAPKGSVDNPYTVAEAVAAIDAGTGITNVYVSGIVSKIVSPYNSEYGNISYNISADGSTLGQQLEAYRGKSFNGENFTSEDDVVFGASVVIYGNLTKHNATYELAENNRLISYDLPTDKAKAEAYLASSSSYTKINGEEQRSSGFASESIVFGDLGLTSGTQYSDPFDGGHFTVTFAGGANDGKYYTEGSAIRVYGGGSITIASSSTIKRIEFTWANGYAPESVGVVNGGTYNVSTYNWTGSANSVVVTRPSGAGQWRLQSIRVACGDYVDVDSVVLRFGVSILASAWDAINDDPNLEITDYGVMFFRTTEAYKNSAPSVESLFRASQSNVAISRKNSDVKPTAENGFYSFTAKVSISSPLNYDMYFCASAFVVINGTDYYFVGEEMRESVRTVAQSNSGTNLSREVLGYLAGN